MMTLTTKTSTPGLRTTNKPIQWQNFIGITARRPTRDFRIKCSATEAGLTDTTGAKGLDLRRKLFTRSFLATLRVIIGLMRIKLMSIKFTQLIGTPSIFKTTMAVKTRFWTLYCRKNDEDKETLGAQYVSTVLARQRDD
jgi:hypothetical protein